MEDDSTNGTPPRPDSLLPYDQWTEEALRQVVRLAIGHVAEHGFPGDHHFYISFRTDAPGVSIPQRLLAQYPHEITIVLQHQFWDLKVDASGFSVGLSFGGVPATLAVPFSVVTGFADPQVQFALRFSPPPELPANDAEVEEPVADAPPEPEPERPAEPQVVSLDAFRKRTPQKET